MQHNVKEPIKEMVHAGKQAFSRGNKGNSEHLGRWKRHMTSAVGTSIGAVVLGGFALVALKKAFDAAHQHNDWTTKDNDLDERLESSLDASDAVASY
jgi:hypothetical protein